MATKQARQIAVGDRLPVADVELVTGDCTFDDTCELVSTAPELSNMIERALDRRGVGETDANAHSVKPSALSNLGDSCTAHAWRHFLTAS